MKKWFLVLLVFLFTVICCRHETSCKSSETHENSKASVIEMMVKSFEDDKLTKEEAIHWDSLNNEGGYMLIRGAERDLDTIVNHIHLVFITEE